MALEGSQSRDFFNEVDFTIAAQAGDVKNVALQIQSSNKDVAARVGVLCFLSDDVDGDGVIATAHDGGVAVGSAGSLIELTAEKVFWIITDATGDANIDITEAGAKTAYLAVILPTGKLVVSGAITHV